MAPAYMGARCRLARISSCIACVVCVCLHSTCRSLGNRPDSMCEAGRKLNICGGSSPCCGGRLSQSMVPRRRRGGVPVFNRPSSKPSSVSALEMPAATPSPTRPPAVRDSPVCINARMKVPVVSTTASAMITAPGDSACASGTNTGIARRSPLRLHSIACALAHHTRAGSCSCTPTQRPASTSNRSTSPCTTRTPCAASSRCTSAR